MLLELGTRGGPEPHRKLVLRSYISEVAVDVFKIAASEFDEFASFEIATLKPERTLLEKLSALHTLGTRTAKNLVKLDPGTKMRHAYDVAMLLGDSVTIAALQTLNLTDTLGDVETRSKIVTGSGPHDHLADSAIAPRFKTFLSRIQT